MANTSVPDVIPSMLVQEDPTFADLVEEFVDSLAHRIRNMKDAVQKGDFATLRTLAHQLKGSGGGHGYPIITETAAAIEQHARNEDLQQCGTGVEKLASITARVVIYP
ncbi:MAG: Hpt domain-containing protein [Phycisphaerae bacterium]